VFVFSFRSVQELAGASFLHNLSSGEAGELAEAIRAVHNGEDRGDLCISQYEVAIWNGKEIIELLKPDEGISTRNNFSVCTALKLFRYCFVPRFSHRMMIKSLQK
jgi:hypothetical protein